MGLEYWPCYHSYRKKCEKLTDQELGRLVRSLMFYSETGERQELAGRESIAFDFIADDIDRAKENYESRCEVNRENGKKRSVANSSDRKRSVANSSETSQSKSESKDKSETESKDKSETESEYLKPPVPARAREDDKELGRVMDFYLDRVNPTPSATCLKLLQAYTGSLGADVVIRSLETAVDERKTGWSYIQAILQRCESMGIRSLADWQRAEDERKKSRESEAQAPARRMSKSEEFAAAGRHHQHTAEEMKKLLADLDKIGGTG